MAVNQILSSHMGSPASSFHLSTNKNVAVDTLGHTNAGNNDTSLSTMGRNTNTDVCNGNNHGNGDGAVHENKRLEISHFVSQFQKILGDMWDSYQIAVSLFIVGKLSRTELMQQIGPILNQKHTKHMHNKLLLSMLANCYKKEPLHGVTSSVFGTSKKRISKNKSSQYEKLKRDVLSLPIRERVRIKGITKESGKKGLIQNTMIQTRQALVPKVPIVTNHSSNNNTNGSTITSSISNASKVNTLEMTLISVKDILEMIGEPLSTETYELPERKKMRDFMLGLVRENGLLGGVSMKAVDVLYLGLTYHLKSIITDILDNVRVKNYGDIDPVEDKIPRNSITITAEDFFDYINLSPSTIKPYGTIDRLINTKLLNDDDYELIYNEVVGSTGGTNDFDGMHNKSRNEDPGTGKEESEGDLWEEIEKVIADHGLNGQPAYVIPEKYTNVSCMLKSHKIIQREKTPHKDDTAPKVNLSLKDKDIGTPDELNWVINDLLSEDC